MNKYLLIRCITCLFALNLCSNFTYAQQEDVKFDNSSQKSEKIKINSDESKVIYLPFDVTKLGVGSPDIAEAILVSSNQVLINAISDGRTNLLLWSGDQLMKDYEVIVGKLRTVDDVADELELLLSDIEGVEIKQVGERILLEGAVYSRSEIERINTITEDIPNVINLTRTSKIYKKLLAEEIQNTIGFESVKVRYSINGYILEGYVTSSDRMKYAVGIAESYASDVINALYVKERNDESEQISRLVEIEVKVMDVNRDAFLDFANDFTVGGAITGSASSVARDQISGNFSLSDSQLRKLEEQGKGRVLLEHVVVSESGKTAEVFVGDEIPITVSQSGGELSTEYRKVGVSLQFSPVLWNVDTVNLDVSVGSSTVSGENATGAPIISNVEVTTSAYIKNGSAIALSGLIRQRQLDSYFGSANRKYRKSQIGKEVGKNISESAFLDAGQDPNRFTRERREVLVIVKPTIISNPINASGKIKKAIERSFKNHELMRYKDPEIKQGSKPAKRIILSSPEHAE